MQLFIYTTQTRTLQVEGEQTIQHVKEFVSEAEGLGTDELCVFHAGKPLDDALLLTSLDDMSTLSVQARMLGGKVHGSLARAGKVKGQTPKVEKQEKKKQKTGRAKRRMQYNRRFVNVVNTFGRRKGPNANS